MGQWGNLLVSFCATVCKLATYLIIAFTAMQENFMGIASLHTHDNFFVDFVDFSAMFTSFFALMMCAYMNYSYSACMLSILTNIYLHEPTLQFKKLFPLNSLACLTILV